MKTVVADFETPEGRKSIQDGLRTLLAGAKPADAVQRSSIRGRSRRSLPSKVPGDAPAFKAWLTGISRKVAEASSEGGLLVIGGVQVSDAEKATLGDIAKALGTSA